MILFKFARAGLQDIFCTRHVCSVLLKYRRMEMIRKIMKILIVKSIILTLFCFSCSSDFNNFDPGSINVLPSPMELKTYKEFFIIDSGTSVAAVNEYEYVAEYLRKHLLKSTGHNLKTKAKVQKNCIIFTSEKAPVKYGNEAYILEVNSLNIIIRANSDSGSFYGVQTLLQLLPPEIYSRSTVNNVAWKVPCLYIKDAPKYKWRSFMLDSGRQFQSVEFIKQYLDYLAMLKINIFHWHLTEGQGWRIKIPKYPKLTEIGSRVADGDEQHGYYTRDEIREIVNYAKDRYIIVVPEIDVPGHSEAALIAYPEYTCFKKTPKTVMGFTPDLFCGGDEKTYDFLEDVLDEVCELFPGEYIHLGGDEAPKTNWNRCPVCRKRIEEEGLKDSHDLQLYFSKRLANYLMKKGKKVILWGDVVYHEGQQLPDNVIIYWWNARGHGDLAYKNAIKRGHRVICGTNNYCYLNYPVTPWSRYKKDRTFDFKKTYLGNPSDLLNPHELVLGMGCCLWTNWYVKMDMINRRVFPRIYSLSEQMWHKGERLSFEKFYEKVKLNYKRLEILNINYGPALAEEVPDDYNWN